MTIHVAIVYGGNTTEHKESIKTTRSLYKRIHDQLSDKYKLHFFYLTQKNKWATEETSLSMITGKLSADSSFTKNISSDLIDNSRILELKNMNCVYSSLMGTSGENGNIMGLADLYGIPMMGCGILASALCADKHLAKLVAHSSGINIVDFVLVNKHDNPSKFMPKIRDYIGYPCFVKPTNLGTCAHVFRAKNEYQFVEKFIDVLNKNHRSTQYLVEKFIDNREVRVFIYEDNHGHLHTNDSYVTELNYNRKEEKANGKRGSLFNHFDNDFPSIIKNKIIDYAKKLFRLFNLKDYARIDFFVEKSTGEIYFNEINTHPFIGARNVEYLKENGLSYADFFKMIVKNNL